MVTLFNTVLPEQKGQTNMLFLELKFEEKSATANSVDALCSHLGAISPGCSPRADFWSFSKIWA